MNRRLGVALGFVLLLSGGVRAEEGVFLGDAWRYHPGESIGGVVSRVLADVVAIPAGIPRWGADDWALAGSVLGVTAMMSIGTPSFDVQFQSFLQNQVLGPGHFTVWNTVGDVVIWTTVGVATVTLLLVGLIGHLPRATETATLMFEAFVVAQLYHNVIKLLTGRGGPNRPELEGKYFGPGEGWKLWPSGTPSGHMASMVALLSVVMGAVDHPVVTVVLHAVALVVGASLVGDDYHWVSDVILGGALGACVGRWVVAHRSTFGPGSGDSAPMIVPLLFPGGAGVGVAFRL